MAYRDKDRQRQASREAMRRHRAKGITQGTTQANNVIPDVIPNYGQPDCQCMHCQQNRANGSRSIINHGTPKPASGLAKNERNRVSLPGDPDYEGVASKHPEWPRVG